MCVRFNSYSDDRITVPHRVFVQRRLMSMHKNSRGNHFVNAVLYAKMHLCAIESNTIHLLYRLSNVQRHVKHNCKVHTAAFEKKHDRHTLRNTTRIYSILLWLVIIILWKCFESIVGVTQVFRKKIKHSNTYIYTKHVPQVSGKLCNIYFWATIIYGHEYFSRL